MHRWRLSAAIGAAIVNSGPVSASPVQAVVSGIYSLDEQRSDNAFEAIDNATVDVSGDERRRTRARLRKSIAVYRIRISGVGSRLGITYDAKAPIVVWIGGDPVKWILVDGFVFDVSAQAAGTATALTFRSDDGERIATYHSVGEDLVEDTTIVSPRFSTPIAFRRVYNRTN